MSETLLKPTSRSLFPVPITHDLRRHAKKLAPAALALIVAIGAATYGHHWWNVGRFIETTDDAYAGGNVTAVSPHVAGFVAQILVGDNQHVEAGQLLVRLDRARFPGGARSCAGALPTSARRRSPGCEAKYVLQQPAIRQAEADLAAKTAARPSPADAIRYRDSGPSTGSDRGRMRSGRRPAEQEAQAATEAAHGGAGRRRQQLCSCSMRKSPKPAPASLRPRPTSKPPGSISATPRSARRSTVISATAPPRSAPMSPAAPISSSVIPAHGLWVDANFKEDQLAHMRPGQPATVVADVLPGKSSTAMCRAWRRATGAVFSVIPPENATGNFTKIVQRVPVRIVARRRRRDAGRVAARPVDDGQRRYASRRAARSDRDARRHRLWLKASCPFVVMCFGGVHGAAGHPDRRLVAAGHRRRALGGAGRDRLGADRLSDRRDHHDPAVGLADPGVLDALAVRRLGRRLHRSPACCAASPGTSRA